MITQSRRCLRINNLKKSLKKQLFNQDIDVSRLYIMFISEIFSFPPNFFSGWNQQIVAFTKLEFWCHQPKLLRNEKITLRQSLLWNQWVDGLKNSDLRAVYPIMLKPFLKLFEDWFLCQKLVDHANLETCKVFRERLNKNNRNKKIKLPKIVQIVGLARKLCHHK